MAVLSDIQIATLAKSAGMNDPKMVAIALAESGGNPDAVNPSGATGLWQILSDPSQSGTGGTRDGIANHNPSINAMHAAQILKEQGLPAWSTYTNGAYFKYMNRAIAAMNGTGPVGASPQVSPTGLTDPASTLSDAFGSLGKAFHTLSDPHTYLRVLYFLLGGWAFLTGCYLVFVSPVKGDVAKAAVSAVKLVK